MPIELVIFDCDGVLVDSEKLAIQVDQEVLAELGWEISLEEIIHRFIGRSNSYFQLEVEKHLKIKLPENWSQLLTQRYRNKFADELKPVPGIFAALEKLEFTSCVASSGSVEKMRYTLGLTGLLPHFEDRLFSSDQVTRGKPEPDLFLFAAQSMKTDPVSCVVVEDSPAGIEGALKAGMQVVAFSNGLVPEDRLEFPKVPILRDMQRLPELIRSIGQR